MDDGRKNLGRPRKRPASSGLERRNLLVNPRSLEELRALYDVSSESEAIRRAVDLALLAEEGRALGEWLASRGGPVDVYGRTTGLSRLPVHLRPEDVGLDVDPGVEADADRAG